METSKKYTEDDKKFPHFKRVFGIKQNYQVEIL